MDKVMQMPDVIAKPRVPYDYIPHRTRRRHLPLIDADK